MHPTSEMMSKCRKWHLREPKFAKVHGGACPQTPLEARASGATKYLPKHKRTPLNRIHPTGLLIQLKVTRKWPEDLLSYRFILTKHIYEKGTTFQWKILERGTFSQK